MYLGHLVWRIGRFSVLVILIFLTATSVGAQDGRLLWIHDSLLPFREQPDNYTEARGATVVFDSIKRELRDFV